MSHLPQPVRSRAFAANRVVRRPSKHIAAPNAPQQQGDLEAAETRRKAMELQAAEAEA